MTGKPRFARLKPREMHKTIGLTISLAGLAAPTAAIAIAVSVLAVPMATPAPAQGIGNIFSDPVPRPPGSIPRGNPQQPPPDEEEEVPALPQGRVLPAPNRPPQTSNLPGPVQSQPLA